MTTQSSKQPAVYIVTNKRNGTLYTGVTSNLPKRIYEHKSHVIKGFSYKYNCTQLVYFEMHETMDAAIEREKQIKAGAAILRLLRHNVPRNDGLLKIRHRAQVT